jgi:hypothetical protein
MPFLSFTGNNDIIHQYQPLQKWHTRDVVDLHKKYGNDGHIVIGTDNCDIRELIC